MPNLNFTETTIQGIIEQLARERVIDINIVVKVIKMFASRLAKEIEGMKVPVTVLTSEKIGAYETPAIKTDQVRLAVNTTLNKVLSLLRPHEEGEKE